MKICPDHPSSSYPLNVVTKLCIQLQCQAGTLNSDSPTLASLQKTNHFFEKAMDSPPFALKPKAALPSHLSNGINHVSHGSSPLARTSVNAKERDRLTASIRSSNTRRQPIDLDTISGPQTNGHGPYDTEGIDEEPGSPTNLDVEARDPRDEAPHPAPPATSRPASPYTLNPPIDFDGLSWPSESPHGCQD